MRTMTKWKQLFDETMTEYNDQMKITIRWKKLFDENNDLMKTVFENNY